MVTCLATLFPYIITGMIPCTKHTWECKLLYLLLVLVSWASCLNNSLHYQLEHSFTMQLSLRLIIE